MKKISTILFSRFTTSYGMHPDEGKFEDENCTVSMSHREIHKIYILELTTYTIHLVWPLNAFPSTQEQG